MDAQVIINSIDQSNYLTSIKRSYNYCNTSQEFTIDLDISCPTTINTYDSVVIYEEGVKVLTGFVSEIKKSAPESKIIISGQDIFVKATDYFVPESYTTEFGQTASYWISFLLDLVGLTATYTDGDGPFVVAEQEIGLSNVSDLVTPLLQYAGWFCKVNPEGQIIIGKISQATTGLSINQGTDIISMDNERSYDKTRNVALVFGGIDTTLNQFTQIFAKRRVDTDFLPTDQTVVIGNPLIGDQESAEKFANELIQAFSKITFVKSYEILGEPLLHAGEYIEVYSDLFTGMALITNISSSFDENGYTMNITLDDLCPRIIASIKLQENLYAGTIANGAWKYNLYEHEWTNISAGLSNLHVNDLSVDNGLYVACTPAGVYTKIINNNWQYQSLPLASGMVIGSGELLYPAVYANVYDLQVNALVTYSGAANEDTRTWLYTGTLISGGTNFRWTSNPVYLNRYLPLGPLGSGVFPSGIITSGALSNGLGLIGLDMEGFYSSKYIVARDSQGEGTVLIEPGETLATSTNWQSNRGQTLGGISNSRTTSPSINLEHQLEGYSEAVQLEPLWAGFANGDLVSNNINVAWVGSDNTFINKLSDGDFVAITGGGNAGAVYFGGRIFVLRSDGAEFATTSLIAINIASGDEDEVWSIISETSVFDGVTRVSMGPVTGGSGNLIYGEILNASGDRPPFLEMHKCLIVSFSIGGASESDITDQINGLDTASSGSNELHPTIGIGYLGGDFSGNLYSTADMLIPGDPDDERRGYALSVSGGGATETFTESEFTPTDVGTLDGIPMPPNYATQSRAYHFNLNGDLVDHNGAIVYTGTASKILTDRSFIYVQEMGMVKVLSASGSEVFDFPVNGSMVMLTGEEVITVEGTSPLLIHVYSKEGGTLLTTVAANTFDNTVHAVVGNYLITSEFESHFTVFEILPPPLQLTTYTYLLNTIDNEFMTELHRGIGFSETNEDVGYPYAVYGASGIVYTNTPDHLFSGFINAGVMTYDMAMRIQAEDTVMYSTTGNGIYKTLASGGANFLRNAVDATEIVARTYGSGEIFFSIGGTAKQSTNDCLTFSDISTGLPGSLITVMRLER